MGDLGPIDWNKTSQLIALIVLGFGTILGCAGKITVFRDRNDIFTTFSMVVGGGFGMYFLYTSVERLLPILQTPARLGVVMLAIGGVSVIVMRSWTDNRRIFSTILAVFTKLPFAILVPALVLHAAAPRGKKASQRAMMRFMALGGLLLLAPLIIALTRDKTGINGLYRYR